MMVKAYDIINLTFACQFERVRIPLSASLKLPVSRNGTLQWSSPIETRATQNEHPPYVLDLLKIYLNRTPTLRPLHQVLIYFAL